jgi:HEAT repeat protein
VPAALALLALAACDGHGVQGSGSGAAASAAPSGPPGGPAAESAVERVRELVQALQPIDPTLTSDLQDQKFLHGRELLSELRASDRQVGLEALRVLREEGSEVVEVERALLDVAAHAAPEDTRPLLETLVTEYGPAMHLRAEAALLIGETSPEAAVRVLQPWLEKTRPGRTMPPMEFLVRGWITACDKLGRSPVEVLADVATNLYMEEAARHLATRALGDHPEPLAIKALESILTESSGNAYMRRLAAQGLVKVLPREEACALFLQVADREADLNFAQFLADVLDKNCGN